MIALKTPKRGLVLVLLAAVSFLTTSLVLGRGSTADAAPCSTTTGASSCTVNTSTTVTAGTLTLEHSPNLYWNFVGTGYDQFASGSSAALTSCAAGSQNTTCSSGVAPKLIVLDATGSNSGWALSAYVTGSNLPAGSTLSFNGAGSATIGNSTASPIATSPFAPTTPVATCDYGSSCTVPSAATTCSHSPIGFATCPTYGVNLLAGTSSTAQVDMYSAAASSGMGASCFGTGTATATGCTGTTSDAFYNLGVKGNATAGTYTGAVVNLSVTSGP